MYTTLAGRYQWASFDVVARMSDSQKIMYLRAIEDERKADRRANDNSINMSDYDENDPESIRAHAERMANLYGRN